MVQQPIVFEEASEPDDERDSDGETRRRSSSLRRRHSNAPSYGWKAPPSPRSRSIGSRRSVNFAPPEQLERDSSSDSDSSYDGSVQDLKGEIVEYLGAVYAMICQFCSPLLKRVPSRNHNIPAVFLMLFVVYYFSKPPSVDSPISFADDVKAKIFPQDKLLGRALLLIGKRLSDPSVAETDGPLAFTLVSGNQTQLNSAVTVATTLLISHYPDSITTEWIQTFSEDTTRDEVRSLINSILFDANGKTLIVLGNIDRLRSTAPLALQTPTDKDNAPYKNPVFVTAIVDEEAFSVPLTRKECTAAVERLLDTAWTSGGLSEDQASPVISRLTTFNICLAPGTF